MDSPAIVAGPAQGKPSRAAPRCSKKAARKFGTLDRPKGSLTLLELPLDILQLIVKEVAGTNDLSALALTNSVFYNLAIPQIYSRFDIVWPDAQLGSSESKSVDALTYGLSTLCIGSAFARSVDPHHPSKLVDNHAEYTRRFSLGNGSSEWAAELAVHKESGRMLGTLVAIAVARMKNLESFYWDMPTGVLARVFQALATLAHQPDDKCKLSRVWVRWHDNHMRPVESGVLDPMDIINGPLLVPQGSQLTPVGIMLPSTAVHPPPRAPVPYSRYHCEYPTFSVLPPLKSLNVLDIDEIGYLDEMAVVIERSKDTLQELRVGISVKAATQAFAQAWDGAGLQQIDHQARWPGESSIGERRLGGVLGVLVGKIYDIRKRRAQEDSGNDVPLAAHTQVNGAAPSTLGGAGPTSQQTMSAKTQGLSTAPKSNKLNIHGRPRLEGKLKLRTLGLERVVLSLQVCRFAIDWSVLTSLTLLDCAQHDRFWKMLYKQFVPTPADGIGLSSGKPSSSPPLQYHLALKTIHTDLVTTYLMEFLKETLAPNSLEALFLQDRRRNIALPLDTIFKFALKPHSGSLRKLLLDSAAKTTSDTIRWRQWALSTDVLLYVTSGRMKRLTELAVSLQHKDWHTFLQRLPQIPHLRSLNIPNLADQPARGYDPREMALQVLDIVAVRPEIKLCYLGVGPKCFEILETREELGVTLGAPASGSAATSASGSGASTPVTPAAAAAAAAATNVTTGAAAANVLPIVAVPAVIGPGGLGLTSALDDDDDDGLEPDSISDSEEDEDDEDEDDEDGEEEDGEEEDGEEEDGEAGDEQAEDEDDEQEEEEDSDTGDAGDVTPPTTASDTEGGGAAAGEGDENGEDDDGFVEPGRGAVRFKLREILFYDDKVAIFKARHAKL